MGRTGTFAAYGSAVVAFGYAAVSLYWTVGGKGLLSTVGGYAGHAAQRGGGAAVVLGLVTVAVKVLVIYGAVVVLAGVLVLAGVITPSGRVDRTALRWHAGVWDLWFLVWGVLLAVAAISYWRAQPRP
jgi:hypothetical protein